MSLDLYFRATRKVEVGSFNYTHNLGEMASKVSFGGGPTDTLYFLLWRPEERGIKQAGEMIVPLELSIGILEGDPKYFKTFNPSNGWGDYDTFLNFCKEVLQCCKENPDAEVEASR